MVLESLVSLSLWTVRTASTALFDVATRKLRASLGLELLACVSLPVFLLYSK